MSNILNPINASLDIDANSFYNTGCIDEINKIVRQCSEFKADISSRVMSQFHLGMGLLFVLLMFRLYVEYGKPKFSQTEFYRTKIAYRLDFAIIITLFCDVALLFF